MITIVRTRHPISLGKEGKTIIRRALHSKMIGNFNPVYCTYKKKEYLVHSTKGDISDPFRRDKSYLDSLYIEVEKEG